MRDYKSIRGLNPKKSVPRHIGQYCAALDTAETELKRQKEAVRDGLGVFLSSLLWEDRIPFEARNLTVSDLIYGGLPAGGGRPAREPAFEEAEKLLRDSWEAVLGEICGKAFAYGYRAGFNRPGELEARLLQDIKMPLSAPLEVIFPADLWELSLKELKERYQETAALVQAEQARFRKDYEAARQRMEEELRERAAAIPYEGEPGHYYTSDKTEELAELKSRYTTEEIKLLRHAGLIRFSGGLKKKYWLDTRPKLDKKAYRTGYMAPYRCEVSREAWKALAESYEEAARQDREAALQEARERNKEKNQRRKRNAAIRTAIVNSIPENYIDFFPLARAMERHFVLHIGPTNSGKTHDAMEALKEAENGIYLGPLRLLAFEQYEALNGAGYPCSLVTGEERLEEEGAMFQASTIEMLNTQREYEVAVIDEA